jgi:hypothetical protein
MLFAWCAGIATDLRTDGDKIRPSQSKITIIIIIMLADIQHI